ncbi:hypothetical protein GF323_02870 [Candidatus Woesearchaeota archaeon]|nr:hypothetical protein [Candidatus Woesearchaeota archaeon]
MYEKTLDLVENTNIQLSTEDMALTGFTIKDDVGKYLRSTNSDGCSFPDNYGWYDIRFFIYDDTSTLVSTNWMGCKATFGLPNGTYRVRVDGKRDQQQGYLPLYEKTMNLQENSIFQLSTTEMALLGISVTDSNGTYIYSQGSDGCSNTPNQQWYNTYLYVHDINNNQIAYSPTLGCKTTLGLSEGVYNLTLVGTETSSSAAIYARNRRYYLENHSCQIRVNLEDDIFYHNCSYSDPYVFMIASTSTNLVQIIGESWNYTYTLDNVAPFPGNFTVGLSGLDPTWYSFDQTYVELNSSRSTDFVLSIYAPDDHLNIGNYSLNLTAYRHDSGQTVIFPLNLSLTTTFNISTNFTNIIIAPNYSIEHTINVSNLAYFPGDFAVSLNGLPSSWYQIDQDQISVGGTSTAKIRITISPPASCAILGNYLFDVTVLRNNGEQKTIQFNLDVGSTISISNLYPINGTRFTDNSVNVAWETDAPGSTVVYYRPENILNYTKLHGSFGYTHSILLQNLTVNTSYYYYVESDNLCSSDQSEERVFHIVETPPIISYEVVEFMSLPDYFVTNLDAYPVNGRKTSAISDVYVNDVRIYAWTNQFLTTVDLAVGANNINLKLVYTNGTNLTYSKLIDYDPFYNTSDLEMVYANTLYTNDSVGTIHYGILVVDVKEDKPLGLIKDSYVRGVIGNGAEIVINDGERWSTSSHTYTNRNLSLFTPPYKLVSSKDGKYIYHIIYIIDFANNSLANYLPATMRHFGTLTNDGNTIFTYHDTGKIDIPTNTFTSLPFNAGQTVNMGGFSASPDGNYAASSSFAYAASLLNLYDGNVGSHLAQWYYAARGSPRADYAGDIVFSPDSRKLYATFYGNSRYGGGGVQVVDTNTPKLEQWTGLYGARSAAIGRDGDIYVSAATGADFRGVVKFAPTKAATEIEKEKIYFSNMAVGYPGALNYIHYKAGSEIVCYTDQDCGLDEWIGAKSCSNDDVYQQYAIYECLNPGTENAICTSSEEPRLVEECGDISHEDWGATYCSGNDIVQERIMHDRGCSIDACYHNQVIETKTLITCPEACTDGKCNSSESGLIFYDNLDSIGSILANEGIAPSVDFVPGIAGNAVNLSINKRIYYPMTGNIDVTNGTLQFWVKPPNANGLGFWDIGSLGSANSWGIYKNSNRLIMEVKNQNNYLQQSWSLNSFIFDDDWHFVTAVWERRNITTYFKVCLDGVCKPDYDGINSNSFPNENGNFYIGWCGWYGYSQSLMDEVKIYDYVKSDDEIRDAYNEHRVKDVQNCTMYKPESKGNVKVNCSGLYVDGEPFLIKGVGYQPIPIGMTATSVAHKQAMYNDVGIRQRDFPLLRSMGANTIRTWYQVMNESFMVDLYNNGDKPIYVLMGFWIQCGQNYGNAAVRQGYKDAFTNYVTQYKDYPAVLGWLIGNENNLGYCSNPAYLDDYLSLANELAEIAYNIEGENYHPVAIVNGGLGGIGDKYNGGDDLSLNYTDFWGINSYRGNSFGSLFEEYTWLSGKPMMITEYGTDALNNSDYTEIEDVQAEWNLGLWKEIENNSLGGTIMAWSDEWWKGVDFGNCGSAAVHDFHCGHGDFPTPDGWSNEEWYGVVRPVDNGNEPDIMEPRKLYYEFQKLWVANKSFSRVLNPGWNLISVPLGPSNRSLGGVLSSIQGSYDKVFAYNGTYRELSSDDKIDPTMGFWIDMTKQDTLSLTGYEIPSGSVRVYTGWNLVGWPYMQANNISNLPVKTYNILGYENGWTSYAPNRTVNSLNALLPGYGYWVKVP